MKKIVLVVLGISVFILAGCQNKSISYEGFLIDEHCAEMKRGEDETLKCIKMDKCENSGYGIAVDMGNEEEKFIKFTEQGHEKAKEFINEVEEYKEKIGKVKVSGHYENEKFVLEKIEYK
ncbi:hypothetical protein [uncultured Clostridium sp.]|uniref:hypothetical protein n=1 Tax=uncultured Clostridium sp. TaxID=59620 RepID=UPI0025E7370E|nr:hypothetical protein [uncultured Clostridium sp.]